jgi:hypothetical protein
MYMYSHSSAARSLKIKMPAPKCTTLSSLKVNHFNIHLSWITVDTALVVKPHREMLADDKNE